MNYWKIGKVLGIRSLISYEGENAHELVEDFHGAVDDYLEMCASESIEPISLNSFVEKSIQNAVNYK